MLIFRPVKNSDLTERNTYIGCEHEHHEILLIESDDSVAGIKHVDLRPATSVCLGIVELSR
jgi:hypothetical protein